MPTRSRRKVVKQTASSTKKVTVKLPDFEEDLVDEQEIEVFETDPAFVTVRAGMTLNMGDYESLRVEVGISMPCYKEMVEETFDAVAEEVNKLLNEESNNYREAHKKRK